MTKDGVDWVIFTLNVIVMNAYKSVFPSCPVEFQLVFFLLMDVQAITAFTNACAMNIKHECMRETIPKKFLLCPLLSVEPDLNHVKNAA